LLMCNKNKMSIHTAAQQVPQVAIQYTHRWP